MNRKKIFISKGKNNSPITWKHINQFLVYSFRVNKSTEPFSHGALSQLSWPVFLRTICFDCWCRSLGNSNFQSHFMEGHWVRLLCFVSANPTNVGNCRNGLGGRWTPPNTCTDSQLVVADDGIHARRKVVRLCAVNSFAPGRFLWYFRWVIFMSILVIDDWHISCEIAIKWM